MSLETVLVNYSSKDRPFSIGLIKELQNLVTEIWIIQLGIGPSKN